MWQSDPWSTDTDGDGIDDFLDPRINTNDRPPEVTAIKSQDPRRYIEIRVREDSSVNVQANPRYDPFSFFDDPYWNPSKATVIEQGSGWYRIEFEGHGLLNEPPERYWVNVTDPHGNRRVLEIDVKEGGGYQIAAAGLAGGSVVAVPKTDPFPEEIAGVIILGVAAVGAYYAINYASSDHEVVRKELLTTEVETFAASETDLAIDVVLPTGSVVSGTDPETGEVVTRGYGWRYIEATSEVTIAEIGHVLTHDPTVIGSGDRLVVIGRNAQDEEVILAIIGGLLMAAQTDATAYDDCTEQNIDIQHSEEHYTRETDPQKPFDDRTTVKQAFDDVVKVFKDSQGNLWYVIAVGNSYTVALVKKASETMLRNGIVFAERYLRTFLTDQRNERTLFRTLESAERAIDEETNNPPTEIDC